MCCCCCCWTALQGAVRLRRQLAEAYLLQHLSSIPINIDLTVGTGSFKPQPAASFRLLRLSSAVPDAAVLDLLHCALQPELVASFNPFLSSTAQQQLHQGLLVWMQLCVLEDRLGRLRKLAAAGPEMKSLLIRVSDCMAHT